MGLHDEHRILQNLDSTYAIILPTNPPRGSEDPEKRIFKFLVPNAGAFQTATQIRELLERERLSKLMDSERRDAEWRLLMSKPHEGMPSYEGKNLSNCKCGKPLSDPIHDDVVIKDYLKNG